MGCDEEEKDIFWNALDQEICELLTKVTSKRTSMDILVVLRRSKESAQWLGSDRPEKSRGRENFKTLQWLVMSVKSSFFKKAEDQYIIYESGRAESQIDFSSCKRNYLVEVKNCKVIKGECVVWW